MKSFNHNQAVSSATWTITHNMNAPVSNIDVLVNYQGSLQKIIPGDIVHTDDNTTTILFSQAFTGRARLLAL